jgi:hypothetical protein
MPLVSKARFADSANAIVGAAPHRFRPRYALARGTRPIPSDFAMTQHHNRRAACKSVCTRPVRFSFLARSYYLDRFLGDFLFKVRNKRAAEGGGGTALSKTIASAVISLP